MKIKRLWLTCYLTFLALALGGTSQGATPKTTPTKHSPSGPASGKHGPAGPGHAGQTKAYHQTHGVRTARGWHFPGRHHHHWSHRVWNERFRRYHYFEPTLRVFYYYDPQQDGFYPVTE